jgi:hypothetical protein
VVTINFDQFLELVKDYTMRIAAGDPKNQPEMAIVGTSLWLPHKQTCEKPVGLLLLFHYPY